MTSGEWFDEVLVCMARKRMKLVDLSRRTGITRQTLYERAKSPETTRLWEMEAINKIVGIKMEVK